MTETASYIITPCERTNEVMLTTPCHRGAALARALCKRVSRTAPYRYFMRPENAAKWIKLFDAGYHPVMRSGRLRFQRDPRPVSLRRALA